MTIVSKGPSCLKYSNFCKAKNIADWFHSFILTSDVDILKKLLKFCTGFRDVYSFDSDKIITLDFLQDEVLPRTSVCTFDLMLPLKCVNEQDFIAMMKVAVNCECEGFAEFWFYFHRKMSVAVIVLEFRK